MRRPRSSPARFLTFAVAAISATTTVALATPSAADSLDSVRADIAAAQQKLAALDSQAEAASERYNAARIKLAGDQQRASIAQARLDRAQRRLGTFRSAIRGFVIAAYQGQGFDSTLGLTADSPQAFLEKVSTLEAVSASQSQVLAGLAAAHRAQEQAQADAAAALKAQRASTAQMQADRAKVLSAAHQEEQIISGLRTREAVLERAARLRAERLAAERAAAALAAREAAAQAAAQALMNQPVSSPVVTGSGGARVAVQWAYRELGKPYVWGAAGPDSFDCSGLTQYVWAKAGVYLDHYTGSQWNEGRHVTEAELQPGDLVFFYAGHDHVGIYVGGGNFIQAPHTGTDVQVTPLSSYQSIYDGAVRPGG